MHVVVAVKQVPRTEVLALGPDGRVAREGRPAETSAYCRRALAMGIQLAHARGGRCSVVSVGPESAEWALREALACGADDAVLLSDPVLAGSDTLVTARALAALVSFLERPDLVLVGKASLDAETGQVGPQLAQLLDLPFAGAVRALELDPEGRTARLRCELEDGGSELHVALPAVLAMAERSCSPAKADPSATEAVEASRVRRLRAYELGVPGPWGAAGSPTRVETVATAAHRRAGVVLEGTVSEQVDAAVRLLLQQGALSGAATMGHREPSRPDPAPEGARDGAGPVVAVVLEPGRERLAAELLGVAARVASGLGGSVTAIGCGPGLPELRWAQGADAEVELVGSAVEEDVAGAIGAWAAGACPAVVLAPATSWGREVAARLAASLEAGLVADVVGLDVVAGRLRGVKPACAGGLLATIAVDSPVQMATVRPGVFPVPPRRVGSGRTQQQTVSVAPRDRVRVERRWRDDDVEALEQAAVVVGVGLGVAPEDYGEVRRLAAFLGAEIGATRKVTDRGLLPRSRQIGITGRNLAPRLYVALGVSGSPNHLSGVQRAAAVVAVNADPTAPVFANCDIGIIGDWREVAAALSARPELAAASHERRPSPAGPVPLP